MSTGVCGIFITNTEDEKTLVDFSFAIVKIMNEKKIGIRLGGNVAPKVYERYKKEPALQGIPFELLDTPLDIAADALFAPASYAPNAISLKTRMDLLQNSFGSALAQKGIAEIVLEIDYIMGEGTEQLQENVEINNFASTVVKLFEESEYEIPYARLHIKK